MYPGAVDFLTSPWARMPLVWRPRSLIAINTPKSAASCLWKLRFHGVCLGCRESTNTEQKREEEEVGNALAVRVTLVSQPFTWNSDAVPTCVRCPHIQLNICYFKGQILIWSTKHLPTKHNWFPQTHFHVQFSTFGRQCFLLFNISRHIKKNPFFSIPTLHTHCDLPVTVVGQLAKSWYNRGKNTCGGPKVRGLLIQQMSQLKCQWWGLYTVLPLV